MLTVGSDPTNVVVVANTTVTDTTGYELQGTVTEVVFLDANGNGTLDAGEALAGVDVIVTIDGTPTTYTTDANGTVTSPGSWPGRPSRSTSTPPTPTSRPVPC